MTAQASENISFEGIELPLLAEPDLPKGHPRLRSIPEDVAMRQNSFVGSSACWRNYIGTWSVRQGILYLVSVEGVFNLSPGPEIPATWFTGTLRMPTGSLINYVHGGYLSKYSSEFFADVERGVVVKTWNEFNEPPEDDA
jgi:hypothetical protein